MEYHIRYILFYLAIFALVVYFLKEPFLIVYYDIKLTLYYAKYHASFKENILEAQREKNLPKLTMMYRHKFNTVHKKLIKLQPNTHWKVLN